MACFSIENLNEALDILDSVPLIDGHNDWPHLIRAYYQNSLDARFEPLKNLAGHVDIKRLMQGKSGGAFWSAFMPCPRTDDDTDESSSFEVVKDTLQQIDLIYRLVELYKEKWEIANEADDILRIFKQRKFVCLIGVEGLHQVGNSSSVLRMYHKLGVRYVTVVHSQNNMFADSATAKAPAHGGLSEAGKAMIREMNRIGMLVDLSHASNDTVLDTLKISTGPVAFTHSSCQGVVASGRNISDEALDRTKVNGGIVMISFIPPLNNVEPEAASIYDVIKNIMYVAEKIGFEHIGLGSDYDGMFKAVKGLEDVSKYPHLVASMLNRGISRENVEKIIGYNLIRVLKGVEKAASCYGNKIIPLEDEVKLLWDKELCALVKSVYPEAES
ncbi:uncharacterized protein EAE98_002479 [Botrytis deweyae]|uniref:Dipeptidase n=1 Tax=Botrytis deweyae TaxID=2478750 RepID=A0ABQ7IX95_9HELO|nr:uncharacterized protein EAE98_002479 [Botrytis deweyae]KAF7936260.1 hypothetical protein EAE98_002479 [Botrytis deweyae]